ncbi:MAG: hydroxyacylglutathione hydrolase [Hyphomicrobiales bacterium]|jgi:hydroxyacylglutathione hydrolase|nr:hydroxyacylglutathione hydrolase [Hyphomicrobiales bacterium]
MQPPASLELQIFRTLSDNCGALIRDRASGLCAAVDAPEASPIMEAAKARGWTISHVFITHEHADHVQGAAALKAATACTVIGPAQAGSGAPLDRIVAEGDEVRLGETPFRIWATPGHAPGHVTWVSAAARLALVGDVVFVMGCGRLSGDTAAQLWRSLSRIAALDDDVTLVTGHDYTFGNARFATAMEPDNAAVMARAAAAERRAASRDFWAVTTVGEEKATNPFFRAGNPALMARLGDSEAGAAFAHLRELKNSFRG